MSKSKVANYERMKNGQWIAPYLRLAIYLRDGFRCQYCGTDMRDRHPFDLTLDHLTCRCNGGNDEPKNLILACRSCNSARGTQSWFKYAPAGAVERIRRARRLRLNKFIVLAKAIIKGTAKNDRAEAVRRICNGR